MDKRMNHACHQALKALSMSDELHIKEITEEIHPYEAADKVANHLVEKGFAKEKPFKNYEITPYGKENLNYFVEEEKDFEKELFEHKMGIIQSWINTIIAVAAFVISIIALCK